MNLNYLQQEGIIRQFFAMHDLIESKNDREKLENFFSGLQKTSKQDNVFIKKAKFLSGVLSLVHPNTKKKLPGIQKQNDMESIKIELINQEKGQYYQQKLQNLLYKWRF